MLDIKTLKSELMLHLEKVQTPEQLEALKISYTGRKGKLTLALRSLSKIDAASRAHIGKELNELRETAEEKIKQVEKGLKEKKQQESLSAEKIDVTLPGKDILNGCSHPITQVFNEIISIFKHCGFSIAEGNDLETDYFNFGALNFPENHPARDSQDTFFVDIKDDTNKNVLLRTHTSPVQIHVMATHTPPIRALMPGRVYRHEAVDASHSAVFHQVEGLAVDTNISFADLKGILTLFVHRMFGSDIQLRFRPSFFPFTEPSAEIDIQCLFCKGKGCGICKKSGWLEMLGAGMVHPNVLRAVNYDPEKLSGYAFGIGVERVAMLKFGISDMRILYENDMKFLKQF